MHKSYSSKKKTSHRCDFGLDALPEGAGVVLVLGGQRVPHPDHVVAHAQRQTPGADGGEGQGVDEPAQGGQRPAAVQRGQVPAFNLGMKNSISELLLELPVTSGIRVTETVTHFSVHGGADEELPFALQEDGAHVEDDPVVALTVRRRPEQSPLRLPRLGQVPHHDLTTGGRQTHRGGKTKRKGGEKNGWRT